MAIVSLLSDVRWNAVARVLSAQTAHRRTEAGAELIAAARHPGCTHVIVDPALVTDIPFEVLVAEVAAVNVPLLLLGDLNKQMVEACLIAESVRPTNALFADAGEIRLLAALLRKPATVDVPALILHSAGRAIATLPACICVPTTGLFTGGVIPAGALALSERAGVDRRTLQRWYARVGITAVARVLTIARLSRAWRIMRSRRLSLERVAWLAGFGSARTFSRRCQSLAGCSPARARECSAYEFADRLAQALMTRTA